ncbi:MAG: hypothetical protein ABL962_17435, partial [Fimbriimonadaceae bacterium]
LESSRQAYAGIPLALPNRLRVGCQLWQGHTDRIADIEINSRCCNLFSNLGAELVNFLIELVERQYYAARHLRPRLVEQRLNPIEVVDAAGHVLVDDRLRGLVDAGETASHNLGGEPFDVRKRMANLPKFN